MAIIPDTQKPFFVTTTITDSCVFVFVLVICILDLTTSAKLRTPTPDKIINKGKSFTNLLSICNSKGYISVDCLPRLLVILTILGFMLTVVILDITAIYSDIDTAKTHNQWGLYGSAVPLFLLMCYILVVYNCDEKVTGSFKIIMIIGFILSLVSTAFHVQVASL